MKIISINVGLPKTITFGSQNIVTSIFKEPIIEKGPVMLKKFNLTGDKQSDLRVHGGRDKALYAFGSDAFSWWEKNRPESKYLPGSFGENLTLDILPEEEIYPGAVYEIGQALVEVTQPRFPCYKLAAKFQDSKIIKQFLLSERSGVYFRVLREGNIQVGDNLELIQEGPRIESIRDVFRRRVKEGNK